MIEKDDIIGMYYTKLVYMATLTKVNYDLMISHPWNMSFRRSNKDYRDTWYEYVIK